MSEIVLSAGIRSNLLSLQNTSKLLDRTQNVLATGLKVNSALDDPTAFFTALGLNDRARELDNLLDSMDLAVQTLRAADEGIQAAIKLAENLKATATQALETPLVATLARSTITGLSASATVSTIAAFDTGDTFTIQVGTAVATTITIGTSTQPLSSILASISAITDVTAYIATDGTLRIEATNGEDLLITDTAGSAAGDLGLSGTFVNGTNRRGFEQDFNALRLQIDQLVGDASYRGINLLQEDSNLTVYFNESQTTSLVIRSQLLDTSPAGLNIDEISIDDWATDPGIRAAIDQVDQAVKRLRQQSSTFGGNLSVVQTRADFTEKLIETLETGATNLTVADVNEEGANLLALQTRQQLGATALSLAAEADQNVLRLF